MAITTYFSNLKTNSNSKIKISSAFLRFGAVVAFSASFAQISKDRPARDRSFLEACNLAHLGSSPSDFPAHGRH